MMKKRKIDLWILSAVTLISCVLAALSFMGVFDGAFFPIDPEILGGQLLFGLLGFVTALAAFVPVWAIYGYIKMAISLHRKGNRRAFVLWLILAPIAAAILIAIAAYLYWITHQVCY